MTADWVKPGAKAVVLQPYDRGLLQAKSVTIERVLARDVVLSDGDRFRLDRLEKQVGGTWGVTLYLVPPDDERVAKTRITIRHRGTKREADAVYMRWTRGQATPAEVASAFTLLADFEKEFVL